jgi:hypothetical protein
MIRIIQSTSFAILASLLLFTSCGSETKEAEEKKVLLTKEELKVSIKQMEDSLKTLQANDIPVENLHRMELANRLKLFYESYPDDPYAPECLDNIHMVYSGMGVHELSIAYADTLLNNYPKYENRAMILESQGSNYDIFSSPRDSAKVRYYYTILLKEYPKMEKEKREGIIDRLANNQLTFDEYLNKKIKDISSK